jgi:hypothetical protein
VAGVERLGREGNLVGGVAAEAPDAGGQAEHGVGFDRDAVVDEFSGPCAWRSWSQDDPLTPTSRAKRSST